ETAKGRETPRGSAGSLAVAAFTPRVVSRGLRFDGHQPGFRLCASRLDEVSDRRRHQQTSPPRTLPAGGDCAAGHSDSGDHIVRFNAVAIKGSAKTDCRAAP